MNFNFTNDKFKLPSIVVAHDCNIVTSYLKLSNHDSLLFFCKFLHGCTKKEGMTIQEAYIDYC